MELAQVDTRLEDEANSNATQYLTFMIAGEEYGVDILKVQGIQGFGKVTPLPHTPDFILGVVNLRGTIVPIIDLRLRFGMDAVERTPNTVVIVVKVLSRGKERIVGLVVDAVSEVHDVYEKDRKPTPDFGTSVNSDYIEGLATSDGRMIILLNIDVLINSGIMELTEDDTEGATENG